MDALYVFISSLFFLWTVRSIFFWLTIWQGEQYRPDRFFYYLFHRRQREPLLFLPITFFKILLLIGFVITIFIDNMLFIYQYFIIALYVLQFMYVIRELGSNGFKKPQLSVRNNFILLLVLLSIIILYMFPLVDKFFWLLLVDFSIPFFVAFYVFVFLFPTELYADWQYEKAANKIQALKDLTVIAITGSIGKSSTKDAIAHMFMKEYKIVQTRGNNLNITQIAKTISAKVQSDTDLFLVDLNAFHKGDIEQICMLIRPKIAVITPITSRSLSHFSSMDQCKQAIFELIESLPKNSLSLFDISNKQTFALYKRTRKRKGFFMKAHANVSVSKTEQGIIATDLKKNNTQTAFTILLNDKKIRLAIPPGFHVEHVLPGIYIAAYLGMRIGEIRKSLHSLKKGVH